MGSAHPTLGGDYSDGDAQVEEWKANVIDGTSSTTTQNWLEGTLGLTESDFDDAFLNELFNGEDLVIPIEKLNLSPTFNIESGTQGTGIRAQLEAAGASECICNAVDTSTNYGPGDDIDASTCEA